MGRWWWSPPRARRGGREKVWDYARSEEIPRLFFVSLRTREHADFRRSTPQIKERLTPKVIPVEIPWAKGPQFHGIIQPVLEALPPLQEGTKPGSTRKGTCRPSYGNGSTLLQGADRADRPKQTIRCLERYLGGEEIGRDEAIAAMKAGMLKGELFPFSAAGRRADLRTRACSRSSSS